jgi:hypothetical protein
LGRSISHQYLDVLPCIDMDTDLEWEMSVLDKIRGQYIALVDNNVLVPGLCWLLKPSKVVTERFPNAATILNVTNMSPMECDLFWKVFKRNYGDKIQQHFGSNAVVRHFLKAPVIIFKSLPFHHQLLMIQPIPHMSKH